MEGSRKNVAPQFVVRTYQLVNDASIDDIISWGAFPNSFIVRNPAEFTEKLLPKYFKHKSFGSFVRQLSYYGFRSLRAGAYEFAHDSFVRFQPHRLSQISRTSKKAAARLNVLAPIPSNSAAEAGTSVLDEEMFRLEQDTYSTELAKVREQQAASARMTQMMCERAQRTDELEQQLMSLVGQILPSPELLAQLLVQNQHNNGVGQEAVIGGEEKSRLDAESVPGLARLDRQASSEGQFEIEKFQANLENVVLPGLAELSRRFEKNVDEGSEYRREEMRKVESQASGTGYLSSGEDGQALDSTQIFASPQVMQKSVKNLTETSDSAFRGEADHEKGQRYYCEAKTLSDYSKAFDPRELIEIDAFMVPPTGGAVEFSVQVTKPDGHGSAMGAFTSFEVFDHIQEKMDSLSFNFQVDAKTTTSTEDSEPDFRSILETFLDKII